MKKPAVVLFLLTAASVYAQQNPAPYPGSMVHINGGTFMMGSPGDERGRFPELEHRRRVLAFRVPGLRRSV